MESVLSLSLLREKLREFDLNNPGYSQRQYFEFALKGMKGNELRDLLINDIKFAKAHGRNVCGSCFGWQGEGKSLFMSALAIICGKIFGVPFTANNVYFSAIQTDLALEQMKPCETALRDEQSRSRHGEMSNLIDDNLIDYEEQLRITQNNLLFASVRDHNHASFFKFQAWQTNFDTKTGLPLSTTALLYTPLTFSTEQFVPRGLITLPAPDKIFLDEYDKRKREYTQSGLKDKSGDNVFGQIKPYAVRIMSLREKDLIKTSKDGFVYPQKEEIIKLVVSEVIGSRKFTITGYRVLIALIREELKNKFAEHNLKINEALDKKKDAKVKKKMEFLENLEAKREEARQRKAEIQREKLAIDKERLQISKNRQEQQETKATK